MNVIHIMADGTVRNSIEGIVIPNEPFYQVLRGIMEKRKQAQSEAQKETN